MALLLGGRLREGWAEYELRQYDEDGALKPDYRGPAELRWSGTECIEGKTILVRSEQGMGDTIQFCRYAAVLASLGATVILEVQEPLRALLGSGSGVARV